MKTHTSDFKNSIKQFGREIDFAISYGVHTLFGDDINSVSIHYEGGILKSVMKQLDLDVNVDIPVDTVLNASFALKVNGEYEAIDYGDFIVYKSEKQEDTNSYKLTCYDKMLYAMKDYEALNITYPITIRDYISAISSHIGLTFASSADTFANYGKQIPNELYLDSDGNSLGYTFRDVLDELAEVTASTICINDLGELEVRYITETNDTIDEEYFKDVNVNFGQKFGAVNTIVLSRSAGADNIYYPATLPENPYEIKISDNQIMNGNDRADYLPDIYEKLNGLEYYLNDFSSPGIMYYDLCDRYTVQIGENTYSCVMFNDEINVTQGLEENIHTDMPEETVTDYTKADKTDRKINQVYLIVDKQNGIIQSLVDKTVYVSDTKSGVGSITLENAYEGELYKLSIKGQISLLYPQSEELYGSPVVPTNGLTPSNTLVPSNAVPYQNTVHYPSSDLFMKTAKLLIDETEYDLDIDFLNYMSNDVCDEFIYENGECKIIRRVGIDSQGEKFALDNEIIEKRKGIALMVNSNSTIALNSFDNAILSSTYLLDNDYTHNFATQVEVSSSIEQTADSINLKVDSKVDSKDYTGANIMLKINQDESEAQINADKVNISANDVLNLLAGNSINLTSKNISINSNNFSVTPAGVVTANSFNSSSANITGGTFKVQGSINENIIEITDSSNSNRKISLGSNVSYFRNIDGYSYVSIENNSSGEPLVNCHSSSSSFSQMTNEGFYSYGGSNNTTDITYGQITTVRVTQTSLESIKKNFEKLGNGLEEILKTDIYKYNLKTEGDNEKKHIGIVIGKKYKYSDAVTSLDKEGKEVGIDSYSMIAVAWQAIKELNEKVERLEKEIEVLKNGR